MAVVAACWSPIMRSVPVPPCPTEARGAARLRAAEFRSWWAPSASHASAQSSMAARTARRRVGIRRTLREMDKVVVSSDKKTVEAERWTPKMERKRERDETLHVGTRTGRYCG